MRKRKRDEINKLGKEYYGFDLEKEIFTSIYAEEMVVENYP